MNKLQIYLTISLNGFKQILQFNPDDEVHQHVTDLSVALEDINYDPKEKNIFYMLKSTDRGVFIIIIRTIPSRIADHLAAWIFVPYDVDADERDITEVVESVRHIVSKSKIRSDEQDELQKLFAKEYPTIDNAGATVENKGKKYAHRYFGGDTGYILSDYLGSKRYQTAYLQYAGVILADKASVISISGTDLTDEPLDQMVRILPPLPDDRPYRPLIFDRPFTQPFLVPLMGTVEIVWESSSAVDIRQSIMINKPNMRPDNISLASTRPTVSRQNYTGPRADTNDEKTTDEKVKDSDNTTDNTKKPEPEKKPAVADTTVPTESAAGRIVNYDRTHIYKFEIPAKSAAISGMIHFEIKTHSTLTGSPIDGYEMSGEMQEGPSRSNHLIYAPNEGIQKKAIWGAIGFVAGILLTLLCTCSFGGGSKTDDTDAEEQTDSTLIYSTPSEIDNADINSQDTKTDAKGAEAAQPTGGNLEAAIQYLDKNKKWERAQMEAFPDLRGLYDDMDNLKRDRIIEYWGPKLKDSRSFATIVDHSQKAKRGNKKPNVKGDTYNNPSSEKTITVRSYLYAIDP